MLSKRTKGGSIKIDLLGFTNAEPEKLISHAAFTCYQDKLPNLDGPLINVKDRLFTTGHHTTLQHWYMTFAIEGISVGDVTFGLHLASPFYNSDQRSGRFCSAMFANPDYSVLENYIREFWPETSGEKISEVMKYLNFTIGCYQENLDEATVLSKKYLAEERPRLQEKALSSNSGKIAQEQMRMFIPIIFPTALDYTINLSSLVALWTTAWNPPLRAITDIMRDLVLENNPQISFMFDSEKRRQSSEDWWLQNKRGTRYHPGGERCKRKPEYLLKEIIFGSGPLIPNSKDMHPIDLLHFKPEMMNNSDSFISARIGISCATMGQDQRHRTIKRTTPDFTGFAYLPPLLAEINLDPELEEAMDRWEEISYGLFCTLGTVLAPYGAMVSYTKSGDLNAISHETAKRLCWNTQEEIYHLNVQMRNEVVKKNPKLEYLFLPPCMKSGVCGEGSRYCGRDLSKLGFTQRRV